MKKKFILLFIPLLIIAFMVFKVYSDAINIIKRPFNAKGDSVEVEVKNGDSLNGLIDSLYSENKIGNSYLIKWYIKKHKLSTNIKPGTYSLPKDISLDKFVESLNKGKYNENAIKVTIPEGYDIEHIAELLQNSGVIEKSQFLESCKQYNLPGYIKEDANRRYALEGFLFPETYYFTKNMAGKDIISMMLKQFESVIADIEKKDNKTLKDEDIDSYVTLASIVERESDKDANKPTIASVFYNRLAKKMPLQSDVTVLYAYGVKNIFDLSPDGILHENKLSIQSPYNTYKVNGLPAGPICNPGKVSIEAAINPSQTSYYYFVATKDGVFFSKTLQEHNTIVNKYLK